MFFMSDIHVHSPSGYLCLGMSKRKEWHTHTQCTHRVIEKLITQAWRLAVFACFLPDLFLFGLCCRAPQRARRPSLAVLAGVPLTWWLRGRSMLIKPKTSRQNLHQTVTLAVTLRRVHVVCVMCSGVQTWAGFWFYPHHVWLQPSLRFPIKQVFSAAHKYAANVVFSSFVSDTVFHLNLRGWCFESNSLAVGIYPGLLFIFFDH